MAEAATDRRTECPTCGKRAKRVGTATLRALLKDEFSREFGGDASSCCNAGEKGDTGCAPVTGDTDWRFCDSRECDVVYFSETGERMFVKSQLRVTVGVKENSGERPLCYCFGHSMASIKEELGGKGRSDALEDIRAKMKDPGCRCETENPSGSCCLGTVTKGIKLAQLELGLDHLAPQSTSPRIKRPSNRGEMIAKVGTLVSAIMASACCWMPLLLLAAGVSGAGIASTLEAYRPVFTVVTFGFLGAAFYFTYRPKRAAGAGHACCSPDAAGDEMGCAPARKGRVRMLTLNKAMLWVVTIAAVAFLLFPSYVGALRGSASGNTVTDNMNRAVFKIEGMTCEGCASIVEKTIRGVPGVQAVVVDYQKGEAVVGTEIRCPVPIDPILGALKKVGYRGTLRNIESRPRDEPTTRPDTSSTTD